jgi:ribulose-bisphosphate carboxylase large chain
VDRLIATYLVVSDPAEIDARAEAIAVEQSVEMPLAAIADPMIHETIVGRVECVVPIAESLFEVRIGLAVATTGHEIGQLLNMLFGNSSIQESIQLIDAELPPSLLKSFSGPRFGIEGLRRLTNAYGRPLTASALKPQGSPVEELARLCGTFARAGIDLIKDDHGLADQAFSPFAKRVAACQKAVTAANRETGGHCVYIPNLSGGPRELFSQIRIAHEEGIGMAMLAPMLQGLAVVKEMIEDHLTVPVLAHPAMAGAARIAPPLLIGKLFRLIGADAVVFPNYGGRFGYTADTCRALAHAARGGWGDLKPVLPVPAGGMSVERVGEMIKTYGQDSVLLIGGGLLSAGEALYEKSRAFVEEVAKAGRNE